MIQSPIDLKWREGSLPNVNSVPLNSIIIAMIFNSKDAFLNSGIENEFNSIRILKPWKNDFAPLNWYCDGLPVHWLGNIKFWAWIDKGSNENI